MLTAVAGINIFAFQFNNNNNKVNKYFEKYTKYNIITKSVKVSIGANLLPIVRLDHVTIFHKNDVNNKLSVSHIKLHISAVSLLKFKLVFDTINIYKNKFIVYINKKYIKIGTLKFDMDSKRKSTQVEQWLMEQQNIILHNVTIKANKVQFKHIKLKYHNNIWQTHSIIITTKFQHQPVAFYFTWYKNQLLSNYKAISSFKVKVLSTINNWKDYLYRGKRNFYSSLKLTVNNNKIVHASGTINAQNLLIGKIELSIKAGISLIKNNTLNINHLMLKIGHKIYFNEDNIKYSNNNNIRRIYLSKLNSTLANRITKKIDIVGNINHIRMSWQKNIQQPETLSANFKNLKVRYKNNILNHMTGNLQLKHDTLHMIVELHNSRLKTGIFNKELFITQANINSNTDINKHKILRFTIRKLITKDLTVYAHGNYNMSSNKINLVINGSKIAANKVTLYIPKYAKQLNIWLKQAIGKGVLTNIKIKIAGRLNQFPFSKNNGTFKMAAKFNNANLKFDKNWPQINSLSGKILLHNNKAFVTVNHGDINKDKVLPSTANIIYSKEHTLVSINAQASGDITYMKQYTHCSPLKVIIPILEKLHPHGAAKLHLHITIPIKYKHKKSSFKGNITLFNNIITYDLPVPVTKHVNGTVYFSNNTLDMKDIKGTVYDGNQLILNSHQDDNKFYFTIHAKKLNMQQITAEYLPYLQSKITGKSNVNIDFTINNNIVDLKAQSMLNGVTVNLPPPIMKKELQNVKLQLHIIQKKDNLTVHASYGNIANIVTVMQNSYKTTINKY